MHIVRYLLVMLITTAVCSATAAEHSWVKLKRQALTQAFSAQEFGDGAHFSYQFLADGTLHGMNMGKTVQGRWRVAGDALCWRWIPSRDPEECYQVRQRSRTVSLFVNGQELFSGDLTPLPSNNPMEVSR